MDEERNGVIEGSGLPYSNCLIEAIYLKSKYGGVRCLHKSATGWWDHSYWIDTKGVFGVPGLNYSYLPTKEWRNWWIEKTNGQLPPPLFKGKIQIFDLEKYLSGDIYNI